MVFEIKNKIALITGAASGLGLCHAKELLKNGLKGVTLADVNEINGDKALKEIEKEFGAGKAIFVKTDVSNKDEFDNAFRKTLDYFKNVDILINNAGILNDLTWEREISVNMIGTINGIILGIENYLKNYKQSDKAVILNTSSIAALRYSEVFPIYAGTKSAIIGMTKSWSHRVHYDRTKVRVLALCPGLTDTSIFLPDNCTVLPHYFEGYNEAKAAANIQKPEAVSKEVVRILKYAENGSVWVVENGEAYEYDPPKKESFIANVLKEQN